MKKFFQKIKNSDVAIPIIAGVVSVLIIGGIIAAVVVYCVRSDKSNGSSSAASAISLDFNFNTSKSTSSALKAKKNKPGASSEVTSVTVGSAPAGVPAVTGGDTQSGGDNNPARPQPRPNTAISHPGTMANVKPTDRAGLAKRNSARAAFLADTFCRDFYNEDFQLLASEYPYKSNEKIDTAWGFGALQSMQTVIARMQKNSKQIARLKKINEGLDYYGYKKNGKFWGYVVNRGPIPMGATDPALAYDDNMWIAINLLRSYEVTGQKSYLTRTKQIMDMLIDEAWFEPLGGFFWDTRHQARHSCSNNPTIKLFVDLYKHTKEKKYLTWAQKVYDFSYANLKNHQLNIYEDLVGAHQENGVWVEGSSAGTGFYSYNTGTMISGAAALYGATGNKKYLDEALSCAQGAIDYFGDKTVKSGYTSFACTSNIWFNAILLRGYVDLYPYAKKQTAGYIEEFQKSMDYGYERYGADKTGYMPYNWIEGWDGTDRTYYKTSLDMSANAEMYGMLAIWQKQRND